MSVSVTRQWDEYFCRLWQSGNLPLSYSEGSLSINHHNHHLNIHRWKSSTLLRYSLSTSFIHHHHRPSLSSSWWYLVQISLHFKYPYLPRWLPLHHFADYFLCCKAFIASSSQYLPSLFSGCTHQWNTSSQGRSISRWILLLLFHAHSSLFSNIIFVHPSTPHLLVFAPCLTHTPPFSTIIFVHSL